MANNEFLKESLGHYKQQRMVKLEELRSIDITIRQILMDLGEPVEQADLVSPGSIVEAKFSASLVPDKVGTTFKPRIDEFFQQSIAEAAKAYLEKIGHAMPAEDILRAITSGGCKVGGADPKRTLSITLGQGKRDFVSTGGGNYGLRKFYNMPKLGRPEGTIPVKKAAKKAMKRTPKKAATRDSRPKGDSTKAKAEMGAAVSEVLSDHKPRTADEIATAVEKRLGYSVNKLAIYGMLRKKDFEQVGDNNYRLRQPAEQVHVVQ